MMGLLAKIVDTVILTAGQMLCQRCQTLDGKFYPCAYHNPDHPAYKVP